MNAYDFDKTIYHGDSSIDFYLYALKRKPVLVRYLPTQILGFLLYFIGKIDKTGLKEHFFSYLRGIDGLEFVNDFWKNSARKMEPWYLAQRAEDDVVISASPHFLLKPICDRMGISCLIASEVDPGSGKFKGANCRGEEKAKRFRAKFGEQRIDCFYSDSLSDLPMAKLADRSYLVTKGRITDWERTQ